MKTFLLLVAIACICVSFIMAILIFDICNSGGYSPGLFIVGVSNVLKILAAGAVLLWLARENE